MITVFNRPRWNCVHLPVILIVILCLCIAGAFYIKELEMPTLLLSKLFTCAGWKSKLMKIVEHSLSLAKTTLFGIIISGFIVIFTDTIIWCILKGSDLVIHPMQTCSRKFLDTMTNLVIHLMQTCSRKFLDAMTKYWKWIVAIFFAVFAIFACILLLDLMLKGSNKCLEDKNCDERHAKCSKGFFGNTCICNEGYERSGLNCIDIDECSRNTFTCSPKAECHNTEGSYKCTCQNGYSGNGYHCQDIDECSQKKHNCSKNANCRNTEGSYDCKCYDGYTRKGQECKDIDECSQKKYNCSKNANCLNTEGSYKCICRDGYTRKGHKCKDIDECSQKKHNCSKNANCLNTKGSYDCICHDGYTRKGQECKDIDECLEKTHKCNEKAKCRNTEGNYTCECSYGYVGDGHYCQERSYDNTNVVTVFFIIIAITIALGLYSRYLVNGPMYIGVIIVGIVIASAVLHIFYVRDMEKVLQPRNPKAFYNAKSNTKFNTRDTDELKNTKVLQEVFVEYDGTPSKLSWGNNGLEMKFEADSLPSNVSKNPLRISTITSSTDFNFPQNLECVSNIFDINSVYPFEKPVELKIEHFFSKANYKKMYFAISYNTKPPYDFQVMDGGTFDSKVGLIKTLTLAIFTIVKDKYLGSTDYSIYLYSDDDHRLRTRNVWAVYLFLTKKSPIFDSRVDDFVHKILDRNLKLYQSKRVELLENISYVEIQIEKKNQSVNITPSSNLLFERDEVDNNDSGSPPQQALLIDNKEIMNPLPKISFMFKGIKNPELKSIIFQTSKQGKCEIRAHDQESPIITTCTEIERVNDLEKVLGSITSFQQDIPKICESLDIGYACNSMSDKTPYSISAKYMEQNGNKCWEQIIVILCHDFQRISLAKDIVGTYGVPEELYNELCYTLKKGL